MIYTIGNIAVSGNTLTGTGTNFKAPLSMIRVGCTVIVKSDPIQIFSITEIVSETELSVTPAASPDIPAGTAYSILLCDSISVDGLAQDVAEALRYFTGQESEIYAAVEYWKNYGDAAQVEALLTAIQAETAQSTANAAATAADVETTSAARDEAIAAKDAAEGYSVLAGEHAATATTQATTATEQATAATNAATAAQTAQTATEAARDEAAAQATVATEQATVATEQATAAAEAAEKASTDADTVAADRIAVYELRICAREEAEKAEAAATAAETSAANVAADEQEIAANAAAAAEAATAAALSEANAKTYAEQAKALSEDSLSLIGLGADRRDWPDCTTDPSAYIGFVRLEEATATGFPSIASGEVYLVGWLARGDGLIINGCFVGTNTRSLYTYMYNNADGTYGWTRHARKDEVSRLTQANNSTGETQLWDGLGQNYIFVNNTGWGAYSVDGAIKLGINYGGTGGGNAGQARHNLAVMHEMKTTLSEIDLNTLTGEYSGIYWQTSSAGATDERHYPTHVAGALVVLKNGANSASGCTQIYYPYNNSDVYYVRWCSGSDLAWSAWVAYASHRETINGIGLGASPRHCSDLTGNPSAYIGFLRLTPAGTTGYPDVASDEGALSGYICRNDGEPSYSGLFVGATTGSAYTYRYSVGGGVQWQRIPRANDLSRFVQNDSTTRMYGPTGGRFFEIHTNGNWGVYSTTDSAWVPLAIAQGGTGATDAATARTNLGLGATNDVQHQNLTLTRTSDGTSGWVAGGMTKSKLLGADGTVRAEGLVYAECNASSPTQITFSIYSPSEGQRYLSFNTKGQILAETAIFRSTYVNPLIIESFNPTVRFNETDRPSGAPYYSFIADGGNWRIQKEGDGYSGEYIISYEYANDRIVIPNLKVEYLYAPADKVQQIKNNLLIPNTGLSRWYDYAAPEGAEADKFYPIIISHPSGWNGDAFVEVSMRTRSMIGSEEPNCNAIHLWMRDGGWSDMGQGCFGRYCAYASNEVAILCVRGTDKGQYPHNAIYVRGDAFPVHLAATVGSTITIPTADWSPSTASDSPTYKWGITDSADGLDLDTYGIAGNLLDFTHGKSGFYSDKQFRHANGDGYLYNHMTVGALNITSTEAFNFRGTSNFYGTVNCGYGYYSVSDDVTKCTYYSRLIDSSGNILGQGEFRVGEYAAQIVVRDLTDTAAHKFFNFNKDGTFHAPNGCVTHTGADWSGHTSDNINKFKPIAGSTNGPSDPTVFGGFHVSFSGNYATQFAGRLSQFWARSIEAGVDQGWKRLLTTDDLSASTDLTVNSLTTTTAVRSGGGDLHILGDTAYREAMNCGLTGYDSTGQNMSWYLGTYKSQEYKVYFEDYLGSEGIELNGDNGSVKLYTGGLATGTPAELTLYDNQCLSTVNYTIKPASSSWDRYFSMENSGTAYHNGTYQFWGNAVYNGGNITGDRYSVFEWKLDTGYLAYLERSADGSQRLQVNGGIHCTAVTQSSDRDLKDNIEVIPDATAAIRKMNGYTYTLKENGLPYAGIIAQEAMEAIPEAVGSFTWEGEELEGPTQDGRELRETARYLNVDYAAVTGLLVQVARETDDRVTALEEENASLRANIAVMDERITKLEALVQQLTGSEE
ncbi:tail fiber domain-containing protein [Escherichia coli]|uniref:tail fiber domain-containing protein n=1 Tax=Escherichia coli TaxID=562 RepID=UPI002023AC96|nr:tail fiber domain-containing protein [Escherichia coli]